MSKKTVHVLCDNGQVMLHDLPLPAGIADRVARGQLKLVSADGGDLDEAATEPAEKPTEETPAAEIAAEGDEPETPEDPAPTAKKTAPAKAK